MRLKTQRRQDGKRAEKTVELNVGSRGVGSDQRRVRDDELIGDLVSGIR
jgi:hypothetical protein